MKIHVKSQIHNVIKHKSETIYESIYYSFIVFIIKYFPYCKILLQQFCIVFLFYTIPYVYYIMMHHGILVYGGKTSRVGTVSSNIFLYVYLNNCRTFQIGISLTKQILQIIGLNTIFFNFMALLSHLNMVRKFCIANIYNITW